MNVIIQYKKDDEKDTEKAVELYKKLIATKPDYKIETNPV